VGEDGMITTTVGEASALCTSLFSALGVREADATVTSWLLTVTEHWGIRSHGLLRVPYYLERIERGGTNATANLTTLKDTGAAVALDGDGGLGHWQAWTAAGLAAERAREHGIATVAVADSGHCGALGLHAMRVASEGLFGIVLSGGPAAMAPPGGRAPVVSTSPIAAGFRAEERTVVVDLALSAVTRGRIAEHAARGEPLQEGWAVDSSGVPTTDPQVALSGMVAPAGGAKGFVLALVLEALTGGVVGPSLATQVADPLSHEAAGLRQGLAHLVIAVNPDALDTSGMARERLAMLCVQVEASGGRLPGTGRTLPEELDPTSILRVSLPTARAIASWATKLGAPLSGEWQPPAG